MLELYSCVFETCNSSSFSYFGLQNFSHSLLQLISWVYHTGWVGMWLLYQTITLFSFRMFRSRDWVLYQWAHFTLL